MVTIPEYAIGAYGILKYGSLNEAAFRIASSERYQKEETFRLVADNCFGFGYMSMLGGSVDVPRLLNRLDGVLEDVVVLYSVDGRVCI